MKPDFFLYLAVPLMLFLQVLLLGFIVLRVRRQPDLMDNLCDLPPEERRAHLVAQCEHFRKMNLYWIDEAHAATNHLQPDPVRAQKASELAALWADVYVLSAGFYRRWEMKL